MRTKHIIFIVKYVQDETLMKIPAFWECGTESTGIWAHCFGGAYCLHLQGNRRVDLHIRRWKYVSPELLYLHISLHDAVYQTAANYKRGYSLPQSSSRPLHCVANIYIAFRTYRGTETGRWTARLGATQFCFAFDSPQEQVKNGALLHILTA